MITSLPRAKVLDFISVVIIPLFSFTPPLPIAFLLVGSGGFARTCPPATNQGETILRTELTRRGRQERIKEGKGAANHESSSGARISKGVTMGDLGSPLAGLLSRCPGLKQN